MGIGSNSTAAGSESPRTITLPLAMLWWRVLPWACTRDLLSSSLTLEVAFQVSLRSPSQLTLLVVHSQISLSSPIISLNSITAPGALSVSDERGSSQKGGSVSLVLSAGSPEWVRHMGCTQPMLPEDVNDGTNGMFDSGVIRSYLILLREIVGPHSALCVAWTRQDSPYVKCWVL